MSNVNIGSCNGLSPVKYQAITWTNVDSWSIWPWGAYFNEILFENQMFSFKKLHLKMPSDKWQTFCSSFSMWHHKQVTSPTCSTTSVPHTVPEPLGLLIWSLTCCYVIHSAHYHTGVEHESRDNCRLNSINKVAKVEGENSSLNSDKLYILPWLTRNGLLLLSPHVPLGSRVSACGNRWIPSSHTDISMG